MPKLTLEEKRLQTLKRQLFGKETHEYRARQNPLGLTPTIKLPPFAISPVPAQPETSYLKSDLLRILILASLLLGAQLLLYLSSLRNLINLPLDDFVKQTLSKV